MKTTTTTTKVFLGPGLLKNNSPGVHKYMYTVQRSNDCDDSCVVCGILF